MRLSEHLLLTLVILAVELPLLAEDDPFEEMMNEEEREEVDDFEKLTSSIFFEAEEMPGVAPKPTDKSAAWKLSLTTPRETSRKCCVNVRQEPLSQKIKVPAKDTYQIWVRYRLETEKRAPFQLRIERDGKNVFQHRYYGFRIAGSGMVQAIQKEHNLWFDIPGMQEGIFSGQEWVWEVARAELPSGEATLVIEPQRASPKFPLTLDCVFITASSAHRPRFSDFHEVWVRYRPIEVEPKDAEYKVDVAVQWLRAVIIQGSLRIHTGAGQLAAPNGDPLRIGQDSNWLELYDELKYGGTYCTTTFVPWRLAELNSVVVEVDVGWGPREGQILKTLRETADVGASVGLAMPTERARTRDDVIGSVWPTEFQDTFETFTELSRARNQRIAKLIPEPVPPSKHFNFCTAVVTPGHTYCSTSVFRLELESVARMGINTLYGHAYRWVRKVGMERHFPERYYTAGASPARYWVRHTCPNHPNVPRAADQRMRLGAKTIVGQTGDTKAGGRVFAMKIGDEIGNAVGRDHVDTCQDCQHRFREFLAGEGLDPARYGRTWQDVRWVGLRETADELRRLLYYYSTRFLSANTAYIHNALIEAAQRHYDPSIPVMYNVNPTPVMGGMALDWFEMERHGGITSQWMEVIGKPEPGRSSFLADLAWNITSRRKLSIGCYCLYVAPRRSARDTLAFIARGATSFIYYSYGPRTLGAADNFSERDPAILAVAEATRPIVATEDFLHGAKRPPRDAVMIYSRTAEIWDDDNALIRDRSFAYMALNHDQVPMDIISEQDVLDGRLKDYRVAYLHGLHLRRDVAQKLAAWVKAGGRLWASIGAAMRDEADNRMDVLDPVFGARQGYVERKYPVTFSYHAALTPDAELGSIRWEAGPWGEAFETPCILQRAGIEPQGAKVVARFDDGLPAAVTNTFGAGRTMLLAYPAGLTYSRFYRTDKREHRYEDGDRRVISQMALDAGVSRPVRVSQPGIEATRLESAKGIAVALIDQLDSKPTVTVELDVPRTPARVRSVKSGDLSFVHKDGKLSFKVTIDNLDIVTIE